METIYENKNNTKKFVIFVLFLLILAGAGYFLWVKYGDKLRQNGQNEQVEQQNWLDEEAKSVTVSPTESGNDTALVSTNTQEFNEAIKKAQTAFGLKNYEQSVQEYREALKFGRSDRVYAGLYISYTAMQDWENARKAVDLALQFAPQNPDYWKWKISLLDEQTPASFADLKKIYDEGMKNLVPNMQINLTTHFAVVAEKNQEASEAIALWQKAIELFPDKKAVYSAEIERINK